MVTTIILAILVPVVVVVLLNEVAPIFFDNLSELITTLAGVDTGSSLGNVILALFATIIFPIIAVVFFVGIASDSLGSRGGGGSV